MAYTILFINFLAYALFFCWQFRKDGWSITAKSTLILIWSIIAFMGWYTFFTGIYQYTFGYRNPDKLDSLPYIYCFLMFCLLIKPFGSNVNTNVLRRFHKRRIEKLSILLAYLLIIVLTFQAILTFQFFSLDVISNYGDLYNERAAGIQVGYGSELLDFLFDKSIAVGRILTPIVYTLLFLTFVGNKRNQGSNLIIIIFITFESILNQLLSANRGGVFFTLMRLTFFIAFFYHFFSKNAKRKISLVFGLSLILITIAMSLVSVSRFNGDSKESNTQNLRYFGEPFPNLGYNIWPKEINHPYGERFFPSISQYLGYSKEHKFEGRQSAHAYWEQQVGIPMLNFKTIFGDLYIEFGLFGAFAFLLICLIVLNFLLSYNNGIVSQITFLSIWYDVAVFGLFGNYMKETWFIDSIYTLLLLFILEYFVFSKNAQTSKLCWFWQFR